MHPPLPVPDARIGLEQGERLIGTGAPDGGQVVLKGMDLLVRFYVLKIDKT